MDIEGRSFIKRGDRLMPADFAASEMLSELPEGKEIIVVIRRPRNPAHHRLFFALLRTVVSNSEYWQTEAELLDALKLATGHVERRMTIDGTPYLAPKSISFASMGQDVFRRFYKRAVYILATKVLGCTPEELMAETDETQSPSVVPERVREPA